MCMCVLQFGIYLADIAHHLRDILYLCNAHAIILFESYARRKINIENGNSEKYKLKIKR